MSHRQVMMIGFENKKRKRKKERKNEPIERYIMLLLKVAAIGKEEGIAMKGRSHLCCSFTFT